VDSDAAKQTLTARKRDLLERLSRLARHTRHREEPLSQDFEEQAVELENQGLMEALDDEVSVELREIDRALARIDKGDYGICAGCGDEIPEGRLAAVPTARLCIACAEKTEVR